MKIAQKQKQPNLLIIAHANLGITRLFAGEFTLFQDHLRRVLVLYDEHNQAEICRQMGYDPRVAVQSQAAGLWMSGYPDQALQQVQQAVAWADHINHPFSRCYAYFFLAYVHQLRREIQAAQANADITLALAQAQQNSFWFAQALMLKGCAMVQAGEGEKGLPTLLQGRSILRALGSNFILHASAPWMGEACLKAGKLRQGLVAIEDAIRQSEQLGIHFSLAQTYQVKGDLLAGLGEFEPAQAALTRALEIAASQQAKGWELRAALSLARLERRLGIAGPGLERLRYTLAWFTQGQDTADLQEARIFLDNPASPTSNPRSAGDLK
jgi:tetratricopeptide (TPR) repeat protein